MSEERDREQVKISDLVVIPPAGETIDEQLNRRIAIARVVGIELLKYFETGEYRSPGQLNTHLEGLAAQYSIEEIDLVDVGSYLVGVLDKADYSSPLSKAFDTMRFHDIDRNVTRQAITTLSALVQQHQIPKVARKENSE